MEFVKGDPGVLPLRYLVWVTGGREKTLSERKKKLVAGCIYNSLI
jgi:hypothetical protein